MALLRVPQMGMFEILKKSYFKESLSLKAVVESRLWACTLSFAFYLFAAVFSSTSDQEPEEKSMLKVKAQDTALPNRQGAGPANPATDLHGESQTQGHCH